jgi:hypothetical protein
VKSNPIIFQDNNEISNKAVSENQNMRAVSIIETVKNDWKFQKALILISERTL